MCPTRILAYSGLCLILLNGPARAQPGPQVQVTIADELVLADGQTRAAVRDSTGQLITHPGDIIRYTLSATNTGQDPAYSVELVDPIPAGTEYVLESARGAAMEIACSIDAGSTYHPPPVQYPVRLPDGQVIEQTAPASRYTHVRWTLTGAIQPGESAAASLEVRVLAGVQE